jgi:hypothetical protein
MRNLKALFSNKKDGKETTPTPAANPIPNQAVELGTILYANLTNDQQHGSYEQAIESAIATGKPIFANFVEWSG